MKKIICLLLCLLAIATCGSAEELGLSQDALKDYGYLSTIREYTDCTRENPLKLMETVHFQIDEVDVYLKAHRSMWGEDGNNYMKKNIFYSSNAYSDYYVIAFRVMTVNNFTDTEITLDRSNIEEYSESWKKGSKEYIFDVTDEFTGFPGAYGRYWFVDKAPKGERVFLRFYPDEYDTEISFWLDPFGILTEE